MSKFSKTVLPYFGDLVAGWSSRMSQSWAHTKIFCSSLVGQCPSHEKYLEYFSKFGFSQLSLATCSWVEGPVVRGPRDFYGLTRDSFMGRASSRKKHLNKFFKIFVLSVLATGPGDLLATWLSREHHVFCANRSIFEPFQFSLEYFWLFIVFPISNLS